MQEIKIRIEGSGRHVHVSQEHLEKLFGAGFQLEVKRYLGSSKVQFLSNQKVTIMSPAGKSCIASILGPCRGQTQVELSFSEARAIGMTPPIRISGDVAGTLPCKLIGPAGEVEISEGVIVAQRHVHTAPKHGELLGVKDGDHVCVRIEGPRNLIYDEVIVRYNKSDVSTMHLDFDEMNAAGLVGSENFGYMFKKE